MPHQFNFNDLALTRRELLQRCGMGFGALALGNLVAGTQKAAAATDPAHIQAPHFTPKAKRVIHIFMNGGPSHVDTFDPKPMLDKYAGQLLPGGSLPTERQTGACVSAATSKHWRGACSTTNRRDGQSVSRPHPST